MKTGALYGLIFKQSTKIVLFRGGRGSGKTHTILQELLIKFANETRCNYLFTTKKDSDVKTTFIVACESIIRDIEKACNVDLGLKINRSINQIKNRHGQYVFMRGFDDPEKAKNVQKIGISFCDELTQYDYSDFKMIASTTREVEDAKVIGAFNPVSITNWVHEELYSNPAWRSRITDIHSTCEDNPFLPEDTKQFYRDFRYTDPSGYKVNYLGEWGVTKTGGEFYVDFDPNEHVKEVNYNENIPIHISVDSNVLPYITVAFWQIDTQNKTAIQFYELPIKAPHNTATKAGRKVVEYLMELGYSGNVNVHGDSSMRASNNIDENKRSFYDLFLEPIRDKYVVRDLMPRSNPPIASTGEFVNAMYRGWEGWKLFISDKCGTSENDYISSKMASDGTILKLKVKDKESGVTYEKHGHFSDTKRYILSNALNDVYYRWKNRFKETPEYYTQPTQASEGFIYDDNNTYDSIF